MAFSLIRPAALEDFMAMIPSKALQATTLATCSSPLGNKVGILFIKGVAVFAMCFYRIAMYTPIQVLFQCYRFQVNRVHTMTNSTKVVKLFTQWDWAYYLFICNPVGAQPFMKSLNLSIALWADAAHPYPTRSYIQKRPLSINKTPKPLLEGGSLSQWIPIDMPPPPMELAKPAPIKWTRATWHGASFLHNSHIVPQRWLALGV